MSTRKKVLVICLNNAQINPRPNRMIKCLKNDYDVAVACHGGFNDPVVKSIAISRTRESLVSKLVHTTRVLLGRYESLLNADNFSNLVDDLKKNEYDFIVTHDIFFLPLLNKYKKNAKVMFDAREYYPGQYEDRLIWRLLYKRMNEYLCDNYLKLPDINVTVSEGIAEEYEKVYGVKYGLLLSWPEYHDLKPKPLEGKIRIIHHGNAFPTRKIEKMIELMDYLDHRFFLDLMVVNRDRKYYQMLQDMVSHRSNVRIIEPVPFHELVPFSSQYDIGLYLTEPGSFNIRHMLPNKFFEFIQSRLAIAIGPSIEMKKFVDKYNLGVVAEDFSPQSLAAKMNELTKEEIAGFKQNSHQLAGQFNAAENCKRIRNIVSNALES